MSLLYQDGLELRSDIARSADDRSRANHTGTQAISTIAGLQDALDSIDDEVLTPLDFGAQGDHVLVYRTCTMAAGSNTLAVSPALPAGVAAGMRIFVDRCGPGGEQLITGIASVNADRTVLTLDDPAVRGITGRNLPLRYGSDDHAAIQALFDHCFATGAKATIPPGPSGVWLVTDTLWWRQSAATSTNVREAQMVTLEINPGATIKWASAEGDGKAVIRFGDATDWDQYLRRGLIEGGSIDCSMVAQIGVDVPFALETGIQNMHVADVRGCGFKVGDMSSLTTTGGVRIDNCRISRSTLTRQLVITGISNASEAVVTLPDNNLDDDRVITIYGSATMTQVNGGFYKLARLDQDRFKLVGVDSTSWPAFTGTAFAVACMPSMRVSWSIADVTLASPAVVELDLAPAEPSGTRVEFHAMEGTSQLEGVKAYIKAVAGQPKKYELYTDAGLTTPLDSSGFGAFSGNGFMTEWVEPDDMEQGIRYENSPDNKTSGNIFRGIRIGVYGDAANNAGWSGTHDDNHFHNLDLDGSMYAHYICGGKNRIIAPYIDGPTKYGFIWQGHVNDVDAIQHYHNPGGIWEARDNFTITHRVESGAEVRTWGGILQGGASSRIFADKVGPGLYFPIRPARFYVTHYPDDELVPRADPKFYAPLQPLIDPASAWATDGTGTTRAIAQSATFDLQAGSGLVTLTNHTSGYSYLLLIGKDNVRIIGNSTFAEGLVEADTLAPTSGKIGFGYSGGKLRITNNSGASATLCLSGVRTRISV